MNRWSSACATLVFLVASCPISITQTPAANTSPEAPASAQDTAPATVFHSETRLVVVDLVATDKSGQPLTGLTKSDCTLLEDGKPQEIQFFEFRTPPAQPKVSPKIDLPANQYTNFPTKPTSSSVNVVLFDVLNTPTNDQLYARAQMIQFLKTLPSGQQVALFQLNETLHMISGFTTESDVLIAAANKLLPGRSALLDTTEEKQSVEDQITESEQAMQGPSHPGTDASSSGLTNRPGVGLGPKSAFDLMREFMHTEQVARSQAEAQITLDAFAQLARALSGYPGRKNVVWLSEGFPISFGITEVTRSQSNQDMIRQTSELLSAQRISVYPVDIRGLNTTGVSVTGSGASLIGYRNGKSRYGDSVSNQELELQAVHDTMNDIAQQTGGEAFFNTNDLKLAMRQSIERGATYYTLAYVPSNRNWDSKFRRIEIKFSRSGVKADYRRGYFATSEQATPEQESHNKLVNSMQASAPVSTMLLLRVQVLPPDEKNPKVRIDYGVYAPDLAFADGPDHHKNAQVEFVALAWDKESHAAANVSETMNLSLPPEHYEAVLKNGLSAHLELDVKPGNYTLRLGAMDYGNGKIGTLDVPLSIADKVQASHSPN